MMRVGDTAARVLVVLSLLFLSLSAAQAAEREGERYGLPHSTGLYAISEPNIFYHNPWFDIEVE